jgi:hypothetical protein
VPLPFANTFKLSAPDNVIAAPNGEFSLLAMVPCWERGNLLDEFVKLPQRNNGEDGGGRREVTGN